MAGGLAVLLVAGQGGVEGQAGHVCGLLPHLLLSQWPLIRPALQWRRPRTATKRAP